MDPFNNMNNMQNMPNMNSMMPGAMPGAPFAPHEDINLWSIILNLAFGFAVGLFIFVGPKETIAYGTKLANSFIKLTGYGQQMSAFGFVATAAPYVVLAPIAGLVVKQLSGVRSMKTFGFFAGAVIIGIIVAFFTHGYFI